MKNGLETRANILKFLSERGQKPQTISQIFSKITKRKIFSNLKLITLRNHLHILANDGKIFKSETRDLHPKRKPILLFHFLENKNNEKTIL